MHFVTFNFIRNWFHFIQWNMKLICLNAILYNFIINFSTYWFMCFVCAFGIFWILISIINISFAVWQQPQNCNSQIEYSVYSMQHETVDEWRMRDVFCCFLFQQSGDRGGGDAQTTHFKKQHIMLITYLMICIPYI